MLEFMMLEFMMLESMMLESMMFVRILDYNHCLVLNPLILYLLHYFVS